MKKNEWKFCIVNFSKGLLIWAWVFFGIFIWLYGLYAFNWWSITESVEDWDVLTASKWNTTIWTITQNLDSLQTQVAAAWWSCQGWWLWIYKDDGTTRIGSLINYNETGNNVDSVIMTYADNSWVIQSMKHWHFVSATAKVYYFSSDCSWDKYIDTWLWRTIYNYPVFDHSTNTSYVWYVRPNCSYWYIPRDVSHYNDSWDCVTSRINSVCYRKQDFSSSSWKIKLCWKWSCFIK